MKKIKRVLACILCVGMLCAGMVGAAAPDPVIYGYREGLAQATANGLWGFANTAGKIVVPIRYESVTDFSLGVARVEKDDKLGLVRQDGIELLPTQYDTLSHIGYGLYLAQQGDLWGVVSLLAFPDGKGGTTHAFFPVTYEAARLDSLGGRESLILTQDGRETVTPLSALPAMMAEKKIPSAQFPLLKGVFPDFVDVGPRDWYALWSDLAYNLGLMEGVGEGRFAPDQILTVAEVVKLAAFLESQATQDDFHLQPIAGRPWYSASLAYCIATGIIPAGGFDSYERPITRAEMVSILSATTLARSLPEINDRGYVASMVPDVVPGEDAAEEILDFYAKGLLTGTDEAMTFRPDGRLTRAEAAAVVVRMARAEQRVLLVREGATD